MVKSTFSPVILTGLGSAYDRAVRIVAPALAVALALLILTSCTWSDTEPGLFGKHASGESPSAVVPEHRNPNLPVAGETTWTSAEGRRVTIRYAVHAVRRTAGMTVLDWSITPLGAPDRQDGDELPSGLDLGLDRADDGGISMVLLDPGTGRVYRPLISAARGARHCLCTPIWAVMGTLRLGETRLLQVAFPSLPTTTRTVDVVAATLPPFSHVLVSGSGQVPTATYPADLARPPDPIEPLAAPQFFQTPEDAESRRKVTLRVDQVLAGSTSTTVRWTLRSMSEQRAFLARPLGPPLATAERPGRPGVPVISPNALSGPTLSAAGGKPTTVRWMTGKVDGRGFLECLCTNLDFWAIGLREAGSAAQLVSTYPPLPRGADQVDLVIPGVVSLSRLSVTPAPDGATRVGPPTRISVQTWRYDQAQPQPGWPIADWPTPVPDADQRGAYLARVDKLVE